MRGSHATRFRFGLPPRVRPAVLAGRRPTARPISRSTSSSAPTACGRRRLVGRRGRIAVDRLEFGEHPIGQRVHADAAEDLQHRKIDREHRVDPDPEIHRHHRVQADVVEHVVGFEVGHGAVEDRGHDAVERDPAIDAEPVGFRGGRENVEYRGFRIAVGERRFGRFEFGEHRRQPSAEPELAGPAPVGGDGDDVGRLLVDQPVEDPGARRRA